MKALGAAKGAHPRLDVVNAEAGARRLASFVIGGPPVTKKNSARIARRRDGTPFILPSKQATSWTDNAVVAIARGFYGRETIAALVACRALVYRQKRTGDLVNYLQAIADALEQAGVVENDRLIVSWDGSRLLHDKHNPRVELHLTAFREVS